VNRTVTPHDIRQLYEQHRRGLLAYACSFLPSFASAEDALHQVFERLLRGDIEITGAPAPYLFHAVRNASLNSIRSQTREVELDEVDRGWLCGPAGMEETAMELQSAMRELPEEQREVIMLHVWGQMSFEETAAALARHFSQHGGLPLSIRLLGAPNARFSSPASSHTTSPSAGNFAGKARPPSARAVEAADEGYSPD
jgi:RNA polymerase sigma-70 factor (ECF subfamily)